MFHKSPENNGYVILTNDDAEIIEDFEYADDVGVNDGMATKLATILMGFRGSLIWAICLSTAIDTTKRLLVNYGFHYPLELAFHYFVVLLFIYLLVFLYRCCCEVWRQAQSDIPTLSLRQSVRQLGADCFLPNTYWITMLPSSLAASASLPLFLEGILHMPSLPVLVMISPLVYATESLTLYLRCASKRNGKGIPWDIAMIITACGIVLYNENRLMVPGLICGVTGVLLLGFSRACFTLGSDITRSHLATEGEGYHGFVMMTLVIGITSSGTMAYFFERNQSTWPISNTALAVMALNIAAIVGISFRASSIIAYSTSPFGGRMSVSGQNQEVVTWVGSTLLLLLVAMFSSPLQYVSWTQIAGFFVSSVCLLGVDQIHDFVLTCLNTKFCLPTDTTNDRKFPRQLITRFSLALIIAGTSFIYAFASSASINSLPVGPSTTYDRSYRPDSRFDIVVSIYEEDPVFVKHMVDQITSTSLLQCLNFEGYKPQIIVYTKNAAADLEALKEVTGADIVERLENLGREGGTYLAHIANKWDSLAEQTMSVQAHAHNIRELIPRINDYLVGDTGMLSLDFTGITCSCGSCGDRWGWEDQSQIIPAIYEKIYSQPCTPSQSLLLSYKSQFVASARRIRGVKRDVYVDLLKSITSQEVTGEDSPSNPLFGFTMERFWSLLMQCATDERVAARCPSLLSGKGIGGLVQDCQCLDTLYE